MRWVGWLLFAIATTIGGALWSLPARVAEPSFIAWFVAFASQRIDMQALDVATLATNIWHYSPYAAVAAVLYLYHLVQAQRAVSPVREHRQLWASSILKVLSGLVSVLVLCGFAGVVAATTYNYRPVAADKLKYHDLAQLSNDALREKALKMVSNIENLRAQYISRRDAILGSYEKQIDRWRSESTAYDKATIEYKAWHAANDRPFGSFDFSHTFDPQATDFGPTPPQFTTPEPSIPADPGPQPESPVVPVDRDWQQKTEAVQEESAAVWEEICHRLGSYPRLFETPATYMLDDTLGKQITRLHDLANSLH